MSTGWPSTAGHPGGGLRPGGPAREPGTISGLPGGRRGRVLALGAVALATVLVITVGYGMATRPGPSPTPPPRTTPAPTPIAVASPGPPSPSARATIGSPASPSPAIAGAWAPVLLAPQVAVADLVPLAADRGGVALTSAFRLTSRTSEPPAALAARLRVEPALELVPDVAAATGDASVTLRPSTALAPGRVYRFELLAADGAVEATWAFQAQQPLRVAGTLPADHATQVPVDTGIEVTFDQDGVIDAAAHFSIVPPVAGTFEQHGRVLVFAPQRLSERTVYTVTIAHGVGLSGSDQVLREDVRFAFETAGSSGYGNRPSVDFERRVFEAATRDVPVLTLYAGREHAPSVGVVVYRFPSLSACLAALEQVAAAPAWTEWVTSDELVDPAGLPAVARFDAGLQLLGPDDSRWWFRLPARLHAGWYLVEATTAGMTVQAFLQVTDVAAFAATTATRSVVWANDLATGRALEGAAALVGGSVPAGTTGANGVAVFDTPPSLAREIDGWWPGQEPAPPLVVRAADGRAALVPLGPWSLGSNAWWSMSSPYGGSYDTSDRYWLLLYTDRTAYRQTDTVHAWGVLRERDGGRVPADLELRLVVSGGDEATAPIAVEHPVPGPQGAFAASIPIRDLPLGAYDLELWSDGVKVADRALQVEVLVKPAYQLTATTDRHAYVAGDPVLVNLSAAFYDGTPVPGVALEANWGADSTARVTTDAGGHATIATTAGAPQPGMQVGRLDVSVSPVQPEEAGISGWAEALTLSSLVYLDGTATIAGSRVHAAGTIRDVDLPAFERAEIGEHWWSVTPEGPPRAGATITATLVEQVVTRTRTGQTYDFIAKKVVPTYQVETHDVPRGTYRTRSAADGSFVLDLPVPANDSSWIVRVSAADSRGRVSQTDLYATQPLPLPSRTRAFLDRDGPSRDAPLNEPQRGTVCEPRTVGRGTYRVGDTVRLAMQDDAGPLPSGGGNAYLFLTEQRGLRAVTVQGSSRFELPFGPAAPPDLVVSGVRFTGTTYEAATDGFIASLDQTQRAVAVTLTPDASRYRPGGTVTLDVGTTRVVDGSPVAATVTLSAVDQKLYDIGAAYPEDPLGDLYAAVGSGLRMSYASHQLPRYVPSPGCGSTTGGGGRMDFRDSVLYRQVETDATGHARVSFGLSDDLTSWHVSASAVTAGLDAGSGWVAIPVGLPFFVDATLAPEYLAGDRPILRVRAYGGSLASGQPVTFVVSSATLPMDPVTVTTTAFTSVDVPLPALPVGSHSVTIDGRAGAGASLRDRLTRSFTVVSTRLVQDRSTTEELGPAFRPQGGQGMTTYVFSDAGRGRFLGTLRALAWEDGPRLDQALAADRARALLGRWFPTLRLDLPPSGFDPARYQPPDQGEGPLGGLALLPYATPDLELSALAVLAAPDAFDGGRLEGCFATVADDVDATAESVDIALAGMAALGDPELSRLQVEARRPGGTVMQQLWLALGLQVLGDDATARDIERTLLASVGERYGTQVRLRVGTTTDDIVRATALAAILAAGLGDPLADGLAAYVADNPGADVLTSLQQVAWVERAIARSASAPAAFAYSVDGTRRTASLEPGESVVLQLTATQRATFSAEPLRGAVAVTTEWQEPLDPEGAAIDPSLSVSRVVSPDGILPRDAFVRVRFHVGLGSQSPGGCYHLVDVAPSGLVPLPWDPESAAELTYTPPYLVVGQAVHFCVTPGDRYPPGYAARVVTSGTYGWESAVLQPASAPDRMAMTPATTLTIR